MKTKTKHSSKSRKREKTARQLILSLFFLLLSILLATIYFKTPTEKTNIKLPQKKPMKKLTIVDEDSNKRPIAIMLDNNVGNNSHAGLQESYLNYEIIVEGGLTRIMAIFKDKDVSTIGPVRSSRHYFLDYALESNCIYTHYGWSTYAENDIRSLRVNNINGLYDSEPFWRDTKIAAPHNVFTSIEKNYAYATKKNYDTETTSWKLLKYNTETVNLNKPKEIKTIVNKETGKKEKVEVANEELLTANSVVIPYSYYQTRSYTYDSTRQVYLRYMNQSPHTDKLTKEQLNYKNIIIERVPNHQLDSYGRQDLDTVGTGTGYYLTNGYALPINWTKSSRHAKTKYTYSDGKEVEINDGNTFIQVVPTTSNITIE